ncbi:MAG: type I restriction enzyme HsdR N-terminal domain-containing protein [Candidatus Cryptobacteroides sp.]
MLLINVAVMQEAKIWDPLRKKTVALTPEEQVRQWFIGVLKEQAGVPEHMMMSEVGMKFGESIGKSGTFGKQYRADILVYDRNAKPLLVVECKRPEVTLGQDVLEQALRYNMVLNVKYIAITNGQNTFICERSASGYRFLDQIPDYEEMLLH